MPKRRKAPKGCFWNGQVLWGRIQVGGHDKKWSLRTDDPATADRRRKSEYDRLIAQTLYGDERRTFQDAFDGWLPYIKGEVGANTLKRYAVSLKQLQPFLEGLYLDEVDKKLIGEIVAGRRAAGVTNATIKRDLTALSGVMDFAVDEEWRDDNPVLAWLRPKARRKSRIREKREPIVLPEHEHIHMVIDRASGLLKEIIRAALKTGCRQDELACATRHSVNHPLKQLSVIGKGRKQRVIDLDGWGYEDVFKPLPIALGSNWLFWHHGGDRYRRVANHFRRIVASVARQAQKQDQKFRPFRFHDLRHRHAVDWLKSGRSIYDLQHRLGHESIATTEIYLKYLTPDEKRAVMFGECLQPQKQEQEQRFQAQE